jgi:general L-amino acid transport system permease protein
MKTHGLLRWVRVNLFANPFDTALSLVFIPLCATVAWQLVHWALTQAQWSVVTDNLRVLMVGTFPSDLVDRAWASAAILGALSAVTLGAAAGWHRIKPLERAIAPAWLIAIVSVGVLLAPAGSERWGGLMMSVIVTLLASVLSIPLGVALALGRRSRFASARILCTGYIEVMRSLPLILIVYWIWVVTPLLAPGNPMPDLLRGLVAFTLFFAAYVAEYVSSGLQSVPRGQVEAAQSLGMSAAQVNREVVLPQAVRVVTPALVGNVLDVFNTEPLLFIIGLTDFLRAGQMVLVNPQSGGRTYEMYAFLFVVYLAIASLITWGARRLEARMAAGRR